ncbi:hypothetical protein [Corynebacterium pseudodiphtheriticum]|uniref:hypothetical protein n=1 Tax=Corynebacterium pseudodiphtheriticum TaxID=37637 RepID=UPI002541156E|nr:hypothetical protein [Corynebacterium pseudodiphtheriticum]MDK4240942.1 hypothetical protein [Corynebacterium pseudodiphtheriticum]MDK4322606.1 hypothetical protein [Corynebacterium pseudodiphtheriticum]
MSIVDNECHAEHKIAASTDSVGDWYDNALAWNVNCYYKTSSSTRTWGDVLDVEIATFDWVDWWNDAMLHQSPG